MLCPFVSFPLIGGVNEGWLTGEAKSIDMLIPWECFIGEFNEKGYICN